MRKVCWSITLFVCGAVGAMACEEEAATPAKRAIPERPPVAIFTPALRQAVLGLNEFGLDLYRRLRAGDENLCVSPYSAAQALGMTAEGARGATAIEMALTLGLKDIPEAERAEALAALAKLLLQDAGDVTFASANALWGRIDPPYGYDEDFTGRLRDVFGAPLQLLDFGRPREAARRIDDWCARETRGRITEIADEENDFTGVAWLILTNAVYFKGDWAQVFPEGATTPQPFTDLQGRRGEMPLMSVQGGFPYHEEAGVQVLSLPYRGGRYELLLILPDAGQGMTSFEDGLRAERLASWSAALQTRKGQVFLPRFKLEAGYDMNAALSAMGMPSAFDETRADFTGMVPPEWRDRMIHGCLYIDQVYQKTFFEVHEKGTEAAAVTKVRMERGVSAEPEWPPFVFRADRPFLFALRHRASGALLFAGRLVRAPQD